MKHTLFLLVSVMTISVSAKKIDFSAAIEKSQQEKSQTAVQIQDYLEVSKSHMDERKPLAEVKKNLFRAPASIQSEANDIQESAQLIADVK